MKFIVILTIARSGSNYLQRLLRNCPGMTSHGEMFRHGGKAGTYAEVWRAAVGEAIADDHALRLWRHRNPGAALDAIKGATGAEPIAFKMFQNNVRREVMTEQILSRDDVGVIIMRRRPIECFISFTKAKALRDQTWRGTDTTGFKPPLDTDFFIHWAERIRDWYEWMEQEVPGRRPCARLSYERHLLDRTPEEALGNALDLIETLGFPRPAVGDEVISIERNDKEADYRKRPSNWAAFEETLRSNPSHASLLDWAMADGMGEG